MEIRRFKGNDMREGMQQVRNCLGDEAIILSTRSVGDQIEILASTESDVLAIAKEEHVPKSVAETKEKRSRESEEPSHFLGEEKLAHLETEIVELKNMLCQELGRLQRFPEPVTGHPDSLVTRLVNTGMSHSYAQELTATWRPKPTTMGQLGGRLAAMISSCDEECVTEKGIHAFVGASGAGKTTTVAKLAARYALKYDRKDIVLISTDRFKIGGQDKLDGYGQLLQIDVMAANSVQELSRLLRRFKNRRMILIDTGGMTRHKRDELLFKYLGKASVNGRKIQNTLVASASSQQNQQDLIIEAFGRKNLSSVVLTKTDEAITLGAALSTLTKHQLPLAYQGNGQGLSDLILPDVRNLVQSFLQGFQHRANIEMRHTESVS
jgi:flagellar biosynthesis protein FlhF